MKETKNTHHHLSPIQLISSSIDLLASQMALRVDPYFTGALDVIAPLQSFSSSVDEETLNVRLESAASFCNRSYFWGRAV